MACSLLTESSRSLPGISGRTLPALWLALTTPPAILPGMLSFHCLRSLIFSLAF